MASNGIAFFAFLLAVVVLIGGSVLELRSLNRDASSDRHRHNRDR